MRMAGFLKLRRIIVEVAKEYLQERANRGSRAHALFYPQKCPDVKPVEGDGI